MDRRDFILDAILKLKRQLNVKEIKVSAKDYDYLESFVPKSPYIPEVMPPRLLHAFDVLITKEKE